MGGEIAHMLRLNPAAELPAQFVGSGLDDRVVGDPHDGARSPIEGHGDLGSLSKQLAKFFLECVRRSVHESSPSVGGIHSQKLRRAADYTNNPRPKFSY
jgi:hypothetical protein